MQQRIGWLLRAARLLWGIPSALLFLSLLAPPVPRGIVWVIALTIMGSACVANARRCGRIHCYITGPVFLGGAGAALAHLLGLIPLAWFWIPLGVAGGTLAGYVVEWTRGTYKKECAP